MFTLIYHPETKEEIRFAVRYYEGECEGLGLRFLEDFDQTAKEISARPEAWPVLGGLFRRHQFRHFPFGLIYRVEGDSIRVLAVMNLHKHPDYWKDRN